MNTILEVRGLCKTFHIHHLGRQIEVFHNVDLQLRCGEFLLVSGRNGVGKSTLLRCLYRSYLPTAGQALYASSYGLLDLATSADVDILVLRREELGHVSQFLRPRPRVSALELVAEPLLASGVAWNEAQENAAALLASFGLNPDLWHAYPSTFSGGEQQKVNLARALIRPRRLLLLDEPTASLDAEARVALAERLARLKRDGTAMIGVLHHPEDVRSLIDSEVHLKSPDDMATLNLMELQDVAE